MRHARPPLRRRRASRSTVTTVASISRAISGGDSARCDPIEPFDDQGERAGDRGCASAWSCRPDARPSIATSAGSPSSASWPTVSMPRRWSFSAVILPTPQSRSTGSGWRNASSSAGGTTSRPSSFGDAARDLREELRPRHSSRDTQADLLEHSAAAAARSRPVVGEALEAADVEERLVDRHSLDERRRVLEEANTALLARVRRHTGLDPHRVRAQPARLEAAHRRADPVRPSPRSSLRARPRGRRSRVALQARIVRCSTDAKNASRSACRIVVSLDTNICSHRPRGRTRRLGSADSHRRERAHDGLEARARGGHRLRRRPREGLLYGEGRLHRRSRHHGLRRDPFRSADAPWLGMLDHARQGSPTLRSDRPARRSSSRTSRPRAPSSSRAGWRRPTSRSSRGARSSSSATRTAIAGRCSSCHRRNRGGGRRWTSSSSSS